MYGPGGDFALHGDGVLMAAADASSTQYCVYSPPAGCWQKSILEGDYYCDNTFIIYRPIYVLDTDCPGLAKLVRKLHYSIAALNPDVPLLRIPHRYSLDSGEDGNSTDEMDDDDLTQ